MKENVPNQDVLNAFGVFGKPVLLDGGEGVCFRVDGVVLKLIKNSVEASWIADIYQNLTSDKFRVPKQIRAKDGSWVYKDWIASEFLDGEHRPGRYAEAIEISKIFHRALADIPKPNWFDQKTDVFAISDKIAWSELPLPDFKIANEQLKRISSLLRQNKLPNQLIHGDWGPGQILFHDTLPPAPLDMTPYFRPADYPIADMLVSAIANEGTDPSVLDLGKNIVNFDQLVLRALIFRTCTYIEFQIHPENDYDWVPVIIKHLNLIDIIVDKIKKYAIIRN